MGLLTAEIAGEIYPTARISYTRNYPFGPTRASVVAVGWESGFAGGDAVEIKRDGSTVWKGKTYDIRPYIEKGVFQEIRAYSLEKKHEDVDVVDRAKTDAPEDFITDGLAGTDLSAGTLNAYGSNIAMLYGSDDDAAWNRIAQNNELAFVTGWEIYVTPAGVLDFKLACGVDRGQTPAVSTVEFKYGELLTDWDRRSPHRVYSRDIANVVKVLGHREGDYLAVGTAGAGAVTRKFTRKNLIDDDTCGKAATAILADLDSAIKYGCMHVVDTYEGAAYDVYDTISVVDRRYGINSDYRIYKIVKDWTASEGESTRIWVTNLTKITGNGPFMLDKTKYRMTAGARAIRNMGRGAQSIVNPDSLDGTDGNVDLGSSGLVGDLGDLDDGVQYGHGFHRPGEIYHGMSHITLNGESISGWTLSTGGTGSVTFKVGKITLSTGANNGSDVTLYTTSYAFSLANNPAMKLVVDMNSDADIDTYILMYDDAGNDNSIGFWIHDNTIQWFIHYDNLTTNGTLVSGFNTGQKYCLEARYTTGSKVEFYVDGTLTYTESTNLPDSVSVYPLYINHTNDAASDKITNIYYYNVQEDFP